MLKSVYRCYICVRPVYCLVLNFLCSEPGVCDRERERSLLVYFIKALVLLRCLFDFLYVDTHSRSKDMACERLSPPYILRRVFGDQSDVLELLVIAVHEIFLDSGLVGFDSVYRTPLDGLQFPKEWPSLATPLSLYYTFSKLLDKDDVSQSIVLNVQRMSITDSVAVSGFLAESNSMLHLALDQQRFSPALNLLHRNCLEEDRMNEVYVLWKLVKDHLILPLSIQLAEKTGEALPPCFMRLSSDLTLKILELLPATDVGKMACVNPKLQSLCSNNDLWKQRYAEEFGNASETRSFGNWKDRFGWAWKTRKNDAKKETRTASYLLDFFDSRGSFTSQLRPSLSLLNHYYKEKESHDSSKKKCLDIDVFC